MGKLLAIMMVLVCLTGGIAFSEASDSIPDNLKDETVVMLEMPYDIEAVSSLHNEQMNGKLASNQVVVQTLSEALLMLTSGRAYSFRTLYDSARYIAAQNEGMVAMEISPTSDLHMIALKENLVAMDIFNTAIESIVADGTAKALWDEHVDGAIDGTEPIAAALPVIEGADTYSVGVSGDCPPIDYTTPDGQPAGYNTAMLATISERAGINITIKQIDSGARFLALASGEIDFFFCQETIEEYLKTSNWDEDVSERLMQQHDISDKYILSASYGTTHGGILTMAN